MKNNPASLTVLACLLFMVSGCSEEPAPPVSTLGKNVVVKVNGSEITKKEYIGQLKRMKRKFRLEPNKEINPAERTWLKEYTLNQIIRDLLLKQEAEKHRVFVSRMELEDRLKQIQADYPQGAFDQHLKRQGITLRDFENQLQNNILTNKLIAEIINKNVSVSDDEMKRYFDEHPEEFQKGDRVRAFHIIVETEEEGRAILKKLSSGGKNFSQLARELSLGPEAPTGGDLGYFEKGQMPVEFDDVFKLKKGQTSDVIRTPYGYHIFKVHDRLPARKMDFEESKKKIYRNQIQEKHQKAFQDWLETVVRKASIEINHELLFQIK